MILGYPTSQKAVGLRKTEDDETAESNGKRK